MKGIKKGLHFIVDGILRLAMILAVVVIVASFFGYRTYIIQSGSMEPVLETGSLVVVNEFADYDDVKVGDIVAFKTVSGAKVTHRVIGITPSGFETKGDNNDISDGVTTTKANFCGITYEFDIPGVGYAAERLNHPNGKIAVIMIVIALLLVEVLLDDDDKEKKKTLAVKKVELMRGSKSSDAEPVAEDNTNQSGCETDES